MNRKKKASRYKRASRLLCYDKLTRSTLSPAVGPINQFEYVTILIIKKLTSRAGSSSVEHFTRIEGVEGPIPSRSTIKVPTIRLAFLWLPWVGIGTPASCQRHAEDGTTIFAYSKKLKANPVIGRGPSLLVHHKN